MSTFMAKAETISRKWYVIDAAGKTYLDAGFLPVLLDAPDGDHAARWDKVREALSYAPVKYAKE